MITSSCLHGFVNRIRGSVVDVRFKEGLPEIQNMLEVPDLMGKISPYFWKSCHTLIVLVYAAWR
ncbi:MAG: hypothetical protein U5K69_08030 [Balneolaceae bacterium]|nr:hypothetical protein [Balneolaceae bacterium]